MVALRLLAALTVWIGGGSLAAAQPALVLRGALEPGDDVCANLCDRYGLVWDGGGPVRVRLATNGFAANLRASGPGGLRAAGDTEVVIVARPGTPVDLEIGEVTPQGGGLYQLQIEPAPSRYRLPPGRGMGGPPPAPPAPPPVASPPPDPARETVARLMRGFEPATALMIGRLEQVPALSFPAKRGHCYRGVIVLAPGARRRPAGPQSPVPAALVRMTLRTARGPEAITESAHSTDRVIAVDDDLCTAADGTLEIAFLDRYRADPVSAPGIGPFTVQLFERPQR